MALPADKSEWPPVELAPVYDRMAVHDAWLRGNPMEIGAHAVDAITHTRHGVAYSGGIVGKIVPAFWGRPVNTRESPTTRLHMPIPADLASISSDQLFAEPPTFRVEGPADRVEPALAARIDAIANGEHMAMMLNEGGGTLSALGGTYYAAHWDQENGPGHVEIRAYDADTVVPEYERGTLVAITVWSTYTTNDATWRHLVRHQAGSIEHALYRSDGSTIGYRRPLRDHVSTASLSMMTGPGVYSDELATIFAVPSTRFHVAYAPNTAKSAEFRKRGVLSMFGRSDFEGQLALFDALDEVWSSWMRDLKQGGGRLFVNEALLQSNGVGQGASFDTAKEIITSLNTLPAVGSSPLLDQVQFRIRVEEHEQTAAAITKQIIRGAGWSMSTYDEYAGGGSRTATEINDLRRRSETTRDKKKRYQGRALAHVVSVALEIDAAVFPGKGGRPGVPVEPTWPEVSQVDPESEARTLALLDGARAISLATKIARANPARDDVWVAEELKRIREDERILDGGLPVE